MGSSALFKSQPLSGPLLQSKSFPPRGILVNRPNSCRLQPRKQISSSAAPAASSTGPRRSFSHFCGQRHGGAVGSVGIGPMATAMAMGRRFMMGLVVVGCSAYNSASSSSYFSAGGASKEEAFVRKTISSHDVVIFSKSYCPYCLMAKDIFKELDKVPHVVELDEREDGIDIQDAIYDFVGRRTVPQVFIKGKHIGGSDDTIEAYETGSLTKLLS